MSVNQTDGCPFCNIPPERIVEAASSAYSVLDAFPVSPGHTLVVPRRHVSDVFALDRNEIIEILRLVRSSKLRLDSELGPSGYNVGVNVGRDAGQTVMHAHVHVIPRFRGDTADPTGGVRRVISGKGRYG
jgi:diadenosine tetraphosphate (Ap4A) HIT family hydrolase